MALGHYPFTTPKSQGDGVYWALLQAIQEGTTADVLLTASKHTFSSQFSDFLVHSISRAQAERYNAEHLLAHTFLQTSDNGAFVKRFASDHASRKSRIQGSETLAKVMDGLRQHVFTSLQMRKLPIISGASTVDSDMSRLLPHITGDTVTSLSEALGVQRNIVRKELKAFVSEMKAIVAEAISEGTSPDIREIIPEYSPQRRGMDEEDVPEELSAKLEPIVGHYNDTEIPEEDSQELIEVAVEEGEVKSTEKNIKAEESNDVEEEKEAYSDYENEFEDYEDDFI